MSREKLNSLEQSNFFVKQIELEQKYFLLPETERLVLDILLTREEPLSEFELYIKIGEQKILGLIQSNKDKKNFSDMLSKTKANLIGIVFSDWRKNHDLSLPSNKKVQGVCENLVPDFLRLVARKEGKKEFRTYALEPDFHATWRSLRAKIVLAIEKHEMAENSLTPQAKRFWRID